MDATLTTRRLSGHREAFLAFEEELLSALRRQGFGENAVFGLRLAVDEALANAVCHAHGGDPERAITVRFGVTEESARVVVEDQGAGYDYLALLDPRDEATRERTHGRGVFLAVQFLSEVHWNEAGNRITLVLWRDRDASLHLPAFKVYDRGEAVVVQAPAELARADPEGRLIVRCVHELVAAGHSSVVIDAAGLPDAPDANVDGAAVLVAHPTARCAPATVADALQALESEALERKES